MLCQRRKLLRRATALLRWAGYLPDGQAVGKVNPSQQKFERWMIFTPVGGQPARSKQ